MFLWCNMIIPAVVQLSVHLFMLYESQSASFSLKSQSG